MIKEHEDLKELIRKVLKENGLSVYYIGVEYSTQPGFNIWMNVEKILKCNVCKQEFTEGNIHQFGEKDNYCDDCVDRNRFQ